MVGGGRGNGIGRSCGGLLAQTVGKGGHRAGKGRGRRRRRRRKRRGNRLDARDTLMDLVNHSRLEACNGLESAHTDCTESDGKEGETPPIWRSDLCNHTTVAFLPSQGCKLKNTSQSGVPNIYQNGCGCGIRTCCGEVDYDNRVMMQERPQQCE